MQRVLKKAKVMSEVEKDKWLCRNCNSLISGDTNICPICRAERPEESSEPMPEDIAEVVTKEEYANTPAAPNKYIFREAVLINSADIILVLGLFCTFGALIAPLIVDFGVVAPMMWAICAAVVLFATTMISWAILRTLGEVSRQLRERENNK